MVLLTSWFVLALVMFFIGAFGSGLLIFSTWIIGLRFGIGDDEPIYVDIRSMVIDRIILNIALVLCLFVEGATLVWDNLSPEHFPLWVRWPIVGLVILAVCTSGLRLFRLYLQAAKQQTANRTQKADLFKSASCD